MYKYPATALDEGDQLLALLGSFWAGLFGGSNQLRAYCDALGRISADAYASALEAFDCVSKDTIPVFRTPGWRVVFVRRSQLSSPVAIPTYGGGRSFGPGGISYGVPSPAAGYRAPDVGVADVAMIFNRVTTPTVSLVAGLDFTLERALDGTTTLVLRADPFAGPEWGTRLVYDDAGAVVDAEAALWLFRPSVDATLVHRHFGYALGLDLPSSEGYKRLVNAALDADVQGTSASIVDRILGALTGVPSAGRDGEVVAAVGRDARGLLAITDAAAYRLPAPSTPIVGAGDVLVAGQPLCDAVVVSELNRGVLPAGVHALVAGPGVVAPSFIADLTFEDRDVPLAVASDPDGIARASFAIAGFPADVGAFWDMVHEAGKRPGNTTFARLLDVRGPAAATEPTAASLPATINPLRFLAANFLRSNCFLATINAGSLAGDAPGLYPLRLLRRVIPPHVCLIILIVLPPVDDPGILSGADDVLGEFVACDGYSDAIAAGTSWDGPNTARIVSRTCQ